MKSEQHNNAGVFMPPTEAQFAAVMLTVIAYVVTVSFNAILAAETHMLILATCVTIKYAVLFMPFALKPMQFGFLHPITFPALWIFFTDITRKLSIHLFGLESHERLANLSSFELTELAAYHELLTAIAGVAFITGFLSTPKIRLKLPSNLRPNNLKLKILLLLIFSSISFILWARANGGIGGLLMIRAVPVAERLVKTAGGHYVILSHLFGYTLITLLAFKPKLYNNLFFWLGIATAMVINFASNGSRSSAIYLLIIVLLVRMFHTKKIPYATLALGAIISLTLLGALNIFRTSQYGNNEINLDNLKEITLIEGLSEGFRDANRRAISASGNLPIIAKAGSEVPLLWGTSYFGVPFAPIPQALLPFEKPNTVGKFNGEYFFNTDSTVPPGPISEAYWNFGIIGVIAIYLLWGVLLKVVASIVEDHSNNPGIAAAFIVFIFYANPGSDAAYSAMHAVIMTLTTSIFLFLKTFRRNNRPQIPFYKV